MGRAEAKHRRPWVSRLLRRLCHDVSAALPCACVPPGQPLPISSRLHARALLRPNPHGAPSPRRPAQTPPPSHLDALSQGPNPRRHNRQLSPGRRGLARGDLPPNEGSRAPGSPPVPGQQTDSPTLALLIAQPRPPPACEEPPLEVRVVLAAHDHAPHLRGAAESHLTADVPRPTPLACGGPRSPPLMEDHGARPGLGMWRLGRPAPPIDSPGRRP